MNADVEPLWSDSAGFRAAVVQRQNNCPCHGKADCPLGRALCCTRCGAVVAWTEASKLMPEPATCLCQIGGASR